MERKACWCNPPKLPVWPTSNSHCTRHYVSSFAIFMAAVRLFWRGPFLFASVRSNVGSRVRHIPGIRLQLLILLGEKPITKVVDYGGKKGRNAYEMAWKTNKQKFQQFLSWTNGLMKRWWKKKRKKAELWKYFLAEIHNKRCIIAIINPLAGCNIHLLIWL